MIKKVWQESYDYSVPTTINYPQIPVQSLLYLSAAHYPDKPATVMYGTEISFWQLKEQVLRLANAMVILGVKKGDRVGLHLPNCPQYVISYMASLAVGAIVVNMNPLYTREELKLIIETTGMETLITFDMPLGVTRPLAKELSLKRVIVTKITDYIAGLGVSTAKELDLEEGWHHFSEMITNCSDTRLPRVEFNSQDPALIQFTGGTTGIPKGAVLTHANIVTGVVQVFQWGNAINGYMPFADRSVLSIIPYFHVYGHMLGMVLAFLTCATQYLVPRFDIDELMDTLSKIRRITMFPAVPTILTAIVNHPKARELDIGKRINLINSGGAPMPVELIQKLRDLGITFCEGWGMSETATLGTVNPLLKPKAGSIGVPLPDNEVRLVDLENGTEDVKLGEPGELIMKGPTVMQGYWNNPTETKNQLKDGWLYTGDVAVADKDGYIFIVDRKKDMIIAGGFNIYPREIDEVLFQHPKIQEAIAVGIPDEYRGETVKAYIVLKPGQTATEREIIDFCKEKLVAYKVPKLVEFRDALPKSAVGKILRKILRDEEAAKNKNKKK